MGALEQRQQPRKCGDVSERASELQKHELEEPSSWPHAPTALSISDLCQLSAPNLTHPFVVFQLFIECLLCARPCSRYWDTTVGEAWKNNALEELTFCWGEVDDKRDTKVNYFIVRERRAMKKIKQGKEGWEG